MTLAEAEEAVSEADVQVLGLIRHEFRLRAPRPGTAIRDGDILVLQADPEGLNNALATLGMRLEEDVAPPKPEEAEGRGCRNGGGRFRWGWRGEGGEAEAGRADRRQRDGPRRTGRHACRTPDRPFRLRDRPAGTLPHQPARHCP
jgi:hypothetical protein